jgi:hypothetical protein
MKGSGERFKNSNRLPPSEMAGTISGGVKRGAVGVYHNALSVRMLPDWFWGKLAAEWKMITAAPISFTFAVIVLSLIGWWILRFFYRERLDSQQHIINLYKERFGPIITDGASGNRTAVSSAPVELPHSFESGRQPPAHANVASAVSSPGTLPADVEHETFGWKGQTRHKCPHGCGYDTYDIEEFRKHIAWCSKRPRGNL